MTARRPIVVGLLVAALGFGGARGAHGLLAEAAQKTRADEPFAPSEGSAPFLALGYREAASDLLFVRLLGYFGSGEATANGVATIAEAIAALDPRHYAVYELGARAIEMAKFGVDQPAYHRAIALLETGAVQFPSDWRIPYIEGMIYAQELKTDDPKQRAAWDESGTLLVESAIRKPHAPGELATWASVMRTRLGQYDRAVSGLREMLLVSSDESARQHILERLAELEHKDGEAIAGEILEARLRFDRQWKAERPALPSSMYLLLGPHRSAHVDMADLATGGRDLFGSHDLVETLPPPDGP